MSKKWWIGLIAAILTAAGTYLASCASTGMAQWDYQFTKNNQIQTGEKTK